MGPENLEGTRGETFTYIKKCFCVCLCFLFGIFFSFSPLFFSILIEHCKGGAHKDDDIRTKVFFVIYIIFITLQNFIHKHIVDLENIQRNKKKEKRKNLRHQVSSNYMSNLSMLKANRL
jgi:hypothetical protein